MRLWSVHPRYLDAAGLTAAWREALLAQKVLAGATRGYRRHPQLERFLPGSALAAGVPRDTGDGPGPPGPLIVAFLHGIVDEAAGRSYSYDRARILGDPPSGVGPVAVTDGQVAYEWTLLRHKLAARSPAVLAVWRDVEVADVHPLFVVVQGPVAPWERVR